MIRPNPFALSLCGNFVVERQEGEIYPNVMTVDEARARQRRAEVHAAEYEAGFDLAGLSVGAAWAAGLYREQASILLTIAADIAEALNGATGSLSDRRAA